MNKKIQIGARIILGLIYFVFGGMGLGIALGLISMPEPQGMSEAAMKFMEGMMGTGYFFPFLKLTEAAFGLMLLLGFAAPLALVVLAPVTLHIFLFHAFLTPSPGEMVLPLLMVIAQILAMSAHWNVYKPMFSKK
jgi:hypothetical protein